MSPTETCPRCAAGPVVPIEYGMPDDDLMEAAERGEAVIGGCIVRPGRDDRCCLGCGRRWSTVLLALPRWPRTVPPENLPDGLHPAAVETLLERHDVTSRVCRALEATNGRYDTPGPRAAYAELLQWIGLRFEIDPVSPHRSGIDELVVPADRVWPARLLLAATDVCDALTMLWSASIREYDQDLDRITRAVERHQRLEALVRLSSDASDDEIRRMALVLGLSDDDLGAADGTV